MGVSNRLKIFFVGSFIICVLLFQNCGGFEGTGGSSDSQFSLGDEVTFAQVKTILDRNCVSCHNAPTAANGNVSYADYQATIETGGVVAGNSIASLLYQVIEDGSMPVGRPPLSLNDSEAIRAWIDQGAPDQEGVVANEIPLVTMPADATIDVSLGQTSLTAQATDPDGQILRTVWSQVSGPAVALSGTMSNQVVISNLQVGTLVFEFLAEDDSGAIVTGRVILTVNNGGTPAPAQVSFAQVIQPIIQARCLNCHNNAQALGGYSMSSYAQIVTRVVAGNALASVLYGRVADNTMPTGANALPLNQTQKDNIATWINQGALNN